MHAYPLYKANELWKSLQNGPGARPRSNVFPLSSSLEKALNVPSNNQENLGESILSDFECDSEDEEDVAQEKQRTRPPLSTDFELNLNFNSLRQYQSSNTEMKSGMKWDVGRNGEVSSDVPPPPNLASKKTSYIPRNTKPTSLLPCPLSLLFFQLNFGG